jgi:catechol 2,3-dioxygenase-like lactoylglutathione lyase family enzyme
MKRILERPNDRSWAAIAPSRRSVLSGIGAAAALPLISSLARAEETAGTVKLPLDSTGLEHVSMQVPDVAAAGLFYGSVFNPNLHKEMEDPLRYYVTLGKAGYIAIGDRRDRPTKIDHYCFLAQGFDPRAMAGVLKAKGLPPGRFGMIPDPDGTSLQLLGAPGGLAKSTMPAGRITEKDPLLTPMGLDHVMVLVSDLDRALPFYRMFFGKEASKNANSAWFSVAGTRLGLRVAPAGDMPRIAHFCVNVAAFDKSKIKDGLIALGAKDVSPSDEGKNYTAFTDPNGLTIELKTA